MTSLSWSMSETMTIAGPSWATPVGLSFAQAISLRFRFP